MQRLRMHPQRKYLGNMISTDPRFIPLRREQLFFFIREKKKTLFSCMLVVWYMQLLRLHERANDSCSAAGISASHSRKSSEKTLFFSPSRCHATLRYLSSLLEYISCRRTQTARASRRKGSATSVRCRVAQCGYGHGALRGGNRSVLPRKDPWGEREKEKEGKCSSLLLLQKGGGRNNMMHKSIFLAVKIVQKIAHKQLLQIFSCNRGLL